MARSAMTLPLIVAAGISCFLAYKAYRGYTDWRDRKPSVVQKRAMKVTVRNSDGSFVGTAKDNLELMYQGKFLEKPQKRKYQPVTGISQGSPYGPGMLEEGKDGRVVLPK